MADGTDKWAGEKVLVISYDFPPEVGGGGVIRVVKFIKWMQQHGWTPVVLTVERPDSFMPDANMLKEIEGVAVYRCKDYFRGIIRSVLMKLAAAKNTLLGSRPPASREVKERGRIAKLLFDLICIPDEGIGWILPAVRKGKEIIQNENISLIFSTCPHFSPHLVGHLLKLRCHVPLVLDYRDRWVGNPILDGYTSWRKKVNRGIERSVVERCDYVVTTTEGQAKHFREEYGATKVSVIWNGYDEEDFAFEAPKRAKTDKLVFSHVGRLTHGRNLKHILEALEGLGDEVLRDIEFNLIGPVSRKNELMAGESGARRTIKIMGSRTHREALTTMLVSDVLVIIQFLEEDGFNAVPGKIFEYIRASRPVLAICPRNSAIWNLVTLNDLGACVDTADSEGIREAMLSFHREWKKGMLTGCSSPAVLDAFSRKRQARNLVEIFGRAING